jgi:hypothetical protein
MLLYLLIENIGTYIPIWAILCEIKKQEQAFAL